jgi:thiamine transport system ATP-binding protein
MTHERSTTGEHSRMGEEPAPVVPVLEARGLTVRHGDLVALAGVDLDVAPHEIVSVLGPSGSGKTTLLRAVAGLAPLTAGRVRRDGVDVTATPPHRRDLGLMFQDHALFPHRDVLGNVAFGLRMRRMAKAEATRRAQEALTLVGLEGFGARSVRELSGGEQQRVALARALAPAPRLLMLDEPFGALDRALRERLVEELRELFSRLALSVLVVTHDQDEAFGLGDRVAVMHEGRIEQVGTPTEVWRRPASATVARFLGWNVLSDPDGPLGDPTLLAIAPDMLRLVEHRAGGGAPGWSGVVASRTFRRDHFRVRVVLDPGDQAPGDQDQDARDHPGDQGAAPQTVEVTSRGTPPDPGDRVRVLVEPGAAVRLPGAPPP